MAGQDPADHHLAQVNIARLLAPLESEQLAGFVAALDPVNALADAAPGFVWRLQTEEGDATAVRPFEDDMMLINMSVWESVETLKAFVYRTDHRDVMVKRKQWFEHVGETYQALWWVPAGHRPDAGEAKERLARLEADGPTPEAFTFRTTFPPPGGNNTA